MFDLDTITHFIKSRIELRALIAILIAACGIWAFVALAGEVLEGDTQALDQDILLLMRSAADPQEPIGPPWLEVFGRDMTAFGGTGVLIMVTAFAALYLFMQDKWRTGLVVIAAIASGFATSQLLKWGFSIPRPDLVPHGTHVTSMSFPSGHAMMSAVTYLTLAILTARVEPRASVRAFLVTCAVIVTILVGVSRVYLAVHWPSDVLAGWTVGAAWAIGWWFVARWIEGAAVTKSETSNLAQDRRLPRSENRR
ncbi:PA-phosphatase related phosphoesterase [Fulvimarina pelagi HTCC2506]|uniref:PA-phosphatase related phosphoesterase n=2 Tax=Fulvimarina pelagi TaxID=217511 RepID=Q0FYA0_9HYPH|nr:phosphatase PAP2 family protein [Fulvimarina pelagi]EAU40095.1 PA-phosphatase related phosphoesterase [Fulvimarina pelagi HTCC2506]BAT31133.1 PA-phosphatase related phosphoesterase [Fulvimarina pelagi]